MSEPLDLERSEAGRKAAESDAAQLRDQLEARDQADSRRADQAALARSVEYGGELGALKRELSRLKQQQEEAQSRYDSTFGENGVQANGGVIRGDNSGGNRRGLEDGNIRVIISFSGSAEFVSLRGQSLGTAET